MNPDSIVVLMTIVNLKLELYNLRHHSSARTEEQSTEESMEREKERDRGGEGAEEVVQRY